MQSLSLASKQILLILSEPKLVILRALYQCDEAPCGCDLVERLGLSKNLLSYHLKQLRELGYVNETPCGRQKQYRLVANKRPFIQQALRLTKMLD